MELTYCSSLSCRRCGDDRRGYRGRVRGQDLRTGEEPAGLHRDGVAQRHTCTQSSRGERFMSSFAQPAPYHTRQMRPYLFLALAASTSWPAFAQIRPTVKNTLELVHEYQPKAGGDTVHYGVFLPYDGKVCLQETGCILGEFNDGSWNGGPSQRLAIMAIDNIDMDSLERAALHEINAMSS